MAEQPKLSVAIATFNRAETLRETIRHLADQTLDPACYEVNIVDDGSSDHTRQVVEEAKANVPFRLTYNYHPNRGIGYTENCAVRLANAPVVLIIADDIFMSREALAEHLSYHERHPGEEVAVLGRVQQSPRLTQSVFLRTWDPFRFTRFSQQTELPYYRFWACNITVKRDFMLRHGGFHNSLGRGGPAAHEDCELGYRLHKSGLRILYCPTALGHHHHVVTLTQACNRSYSQGLNFGEFNALVPEPEIPVVYHVFNIHTFRDHLRAWFGPRRLYLPPGDRNPVVLLTLYSLRWLAFNGLTVRFFWRPLMDYAERYNFVARRMNREMYRGMTLYHFLKGCRDGDRKFGRMLSMGGPPAEAPSRPG